MIKFTLCNPTEIRFGLGQIAALDELVPPKASVLVLYGGGSIKRNGVYRQVTDALKCRTLEEFGGVEPNPVYETLQKAARFAREKNIDFIIGVGGGSVIDAAKFLAAMIASGEDDPWEMLKPEDPDVTPLPNGCVLTLPATGSESNKVSVISSTERRLKIPFKNQLGRPRFAIMDPSTMLSLDKQQLQNGAVDAMTHVLEQYMTSPVNTPIQYGFSETIMKVLVEWGPVLVETCSLDACENVMWAANQALNGLIGAGVPEDWSTHMIGHAITALYGVDHARTLTMIMPSLMRYKIKDKEKMLARLARNVFNVDEMNDAKAAEIGIQKVEEFMSSMGCPVRISETGIDISSDDLIELLEMSGDTALGENADIRSENVREILKMSA
jgi:NADP-dependent alcohol dehydrogenase